MDFYQVDYLIMRKQPSKRRLYSYLKPTSHKVLMIYGTYEQGMMWTEDKPDRFEEDCPCVRCKKRRKK